MRDNASLMPYGTFVEFISGKDDLLHISEIGWKRLETVVLIKIVMIAGLAGSTETKIRSYTLYIIPGRLNTIRDFFIKSSDHIADISHGSDKTVERIFSSLLHLMHLRNAAGAKQTEKNASRRTEGRFYHTFTSKLFPHLGQAARCFPLIFFSRRTALQYGHFLYT